MSERKERKRRKVDVKKVSGKEEQRKGKNERVKKHKRIRGRVSVSRGGGFLKSIQ